MTLRLYNMTDRVARLLEFDDDSLAIDSLLLDLEGDINHKTEGVCMAIRTLKAEEAAFAAEAKMMKAKATARANRAKGLTAYLLVNLQNAGLTSAGGSILNAKIQRSGPRCIVFDEEDIPEKWWRVIPERREVNKKSILAHVKETGEIPDGVDIVRGSSLRIR